MSIGSHGDESAHNYNETFERYEISLIQTRLLAAMVEPTFRDFPWNMPAYVQDLHRDMWDELDYQRAQMAADRRAARLLGEETPPQKDIEAGYPDGYEVTGDTDEAKKLKGLFFEAAWTAANIGLAKEHRRDAPIGDLHESFRTDYLEEMFEMVKLAAHQGLVMMFAHTDAFLSETVRAICLRVPSIRKTDKQSLEWRSSLDAGSWDSLMDVLVEEYAFSFARRKTLVDRVDESSRRFRLQLEAWTDKERRVLAHSEHLRHAIIHNGGKVNPELLRRLRPEYADGKIAEDILIEDNFFDVV